MKLMRPFLFAVLATLSFASDAMAAGQPGFAKVPAFPPYSNQPFYVQINEAVNPATGLPWNFISKTQAAAVCAMLNPNGNLLTNSLWQAIVRPAELVADNWTGGAVGGGALKADLKIPDGSGGWSTFNGMGDGFWEFVLGQAPASFTWVEVYKFGYMGLDPNYGVEFTINDLTGTDKFHFGPAGNYGASALLGITTNRHSVSIMRGGDDSEPGAFGAAMNHDGEAASDVGFRCAYPAGGS